MKVLSTAIAIGCGLFGVAFVIGSLEAQTESKFLLRMCNSSGVPNVHMALTTREDFPGRWRVSGWYSVPDSGCVDFGRYFGPTFYYYAQGGGYHWGANDSMQCIHPRRKFDRFIGTENYSCAAEEILIGFSKKELLPGNSTYELTLR